MLSIAPLTRFSRAARARIGRPRAWIAPRFLSFTAQPVPPPPHPKRPPEPKIVTPPVFVPKPPPPEVFIGAANYLEDSYSDNDPFASEKRGVRTKTDKAAPTRVVQPKAEPNDVLSELLEDVSQSGHAPSSIKTQAPATPKIDERGPVPSNQGLAKESASLLAALSKFEKQSKFKTSTESKVAPASAAKPKPQAKPNADRNAAPSKIETNGGAKSYPRYEPKFQTLAAPEEAADVVRSPVTIHPSLMKSALLPDDQVEIASAASRNDPTTHYADESIERTLRHITLETLDPSPESKAETLHAFLLDQLLQDHVPHKYLKMVFVHAILYPDSDLPPYLIGRLLREFLNDGLVNEALELTSIALAADRNVPFRVTADLLEAFAKSRSSGHSSDAFLRNLAVKMPRTLNHFAKAACFVDSSKLAADIVKVLIAEKRLQHSTLHIFLAYLFGIDTPELVELDGAHDISYQTRSPSQVDANLRLAVETAHNAESCLKLNTTTFELLIQGFINNKQVDSAAELFTQLRERVGRPSTASMVALIDAYAALGREDEAKKYEEILSSYLTNGADLMRTILEAREAIKRRESRVATIAALAAKRQQTARYMPPPLKRGARG